MQIYYFGNKGEKVGPITKEGLVNLAKAGVVTEQTAFEINGKTVKGKHIKNLRPIFEEQKKTEPDPLPPPVEIRDEQPLPFPPENTNVETSGDDFYKTAKVGFDPPENITESSFKEKFQSSFIKKKHGREKTKESGSSERQPLAYVKFRWCYRVVAIFLHIVFAIAMLIFITGYFQATSLRHTGENGKRDFEEKIKSLLQVKSYQELGAFLDRANKADKNVDSEQNIDNQFWEKYKEHGIKSFDYTKMLAELENQMKEAYDKIMVDLAEANNGKIDYPKFEAQGQTIDAIFSDDDDEKVLAVSGTLTPVEIYSDHVTETFNQLIIEGVVNARSCRIYIFGILATYLNLLLLYYFMTAMVTSAETTYKTMILLEKSLKSKENQERDKEGRI